MQNMPLGDDESYVGGGRDGRCGVATLGGGGQEVALQGAVIALGRVAICSARAHMPGKPIFYSYDLGIWIDRH